MHVDSVLKQHFESIQILLTRSFAQMPDETPTWSNGLPRGIGTYLLMNWQVDRPLALLHQALPLETRPRPQVVRLIRRVQEERSTEKSAKELEPSLSPNGIEVKMRFRCRPLRAKMRCRRIVRV